MKLLNLEEFKSATHIFLSCALSSVQYICREDRLMFDCSYKRCVDRHCECVIWMSGELFFQARAQVR